MSHAKEKSNYIVLLPMCTETNNTSSSYKNESRLYIVNSLGACVTYPPPILVRGEVPFKLELNG